jgi:ATP-independent RNA helicase DbpA
MFRLEALNDFMKSSYSTEDIPAGMPLRTSGDEPEMVTLSINGGRENRISAGDILGALTADGGISGEDVGRIDRLDRVSFIAVRRGVKNRAVRVLEKGRVKGRRFKVMVRDGG